MRTHKVTVEIPIPNKCLEPLRFRAPHFGLTWVTWHDVLQRGNA